MEITEKVQLCGKARLMRNDDELKAVGVGWNEGKAPDFSGALITKTSFILVMSLLVF